MKNLRKLSQIRILAQKIDNEKFQRQYKKIINPILEKYRKKITTDDEMRHDIKQAIKKIKRIATSCQYISNCPSNRKNYTKPDYSDHYNLRMIEFYCNKELLREKRRFANAN